MAQQSATLHWLKITSLKGTDNSLWTEYNTFPLRLMSKKTNFVFMQSYTEHGIANITLFNQIINYFHAGQQAWIVMN